MIAPAETILEGHGVRLEPLTAAHAGDLQAAASDGRLWQLWYTSVPAPADVPAYIEAALAGQAAGRMLPWAVRELESGEIAGSTRILRHRRRDRSRRDRLHVVRAALATHARQHRLQAAAFAHAFESLGVRSSGCAPTIAIWSRSAIAALGARLDGVLRHHQARRDGTVRDSWMYSVLAREWPDVKRRLRQRLERHRDPGM